jgi:predicted ATP-grasp superfamily ATP-dependent carboligase
MPRILVYEFICGGALADQPLPDSLASEGWAMLSSVVEDFSKVEGMEVWTTLDSRIKKSLPAEVKEFRLEEEREALQSLASDCDYVLVIAPETGGILLERTVWLRNSSARWLGCSSTAIEITTDKFRFGNYVNENGLPALTGWLLQSENIEGLEFPIVIKPRDGAGSQDTFLVHAEDELRNAFDLLKGKEGQFIYQPLCPGQPVSVAFFCGPEGVTALPPCSQNLSGDGRFRYLGGRVPLKKKLADRATSLATQAVHAVDGLLGFVGVDLLLGGEPKEDRVVEVNPRLTTSYVGLRQAVDVNLAGQLLAIVDGVPRSAGLQAARDIEFRSDGGWM